MAGPFAGGAGGSSGLRFTYLDSAGAILSAVSANAPLVAAISISVRGQTKNVDLTGAGPATLTDSLHVDVGVRNRQ
jgi:hypothetical protein